MKFTRIKDGLAGERTAAVEPRPAPEVEATWQRERFVTGRTVSAAALEAEQDHRAGRVTGLGQALRAGVCDGLEVEAAQDGSNRLRLLTVAAGWGLCANGEDIVVPETLTVQAGQLPVRLTPSVRFGKLADASTSREPTLTELLSLRASLIKQIDRAGRVSTTETPPIRAEASTDALAAVAAEARSARRPSTTLTGTVNLATTTLVSDLASLPRFKPRPFAAVLVLEPARVEELAGAGDPSRDPCERDPEAEPFEDWRYVDAARLCWIPVEALADERPDPPSAEPPIEIMSSRADAAELVAAPTDPRALPADPWFKRRVHAIEGQRFRNELAWALFREEALLGPDETLPWSRDALPVALVAFSGLGDILWVDRAAVVRAGGLRTEGAPTGVERGGPALWQARVEQLNQQLAGLELDASAPLATHVRYLPPAGVLPVELLDANERACKSFPAGWGLNAAPIPIDQLDAAMRGAAALDPFDLDSPDNEEIKLLVPVAPPLWDPHLLQIESVHPAFQATLRRVEGRRDELLERRLELRTKISALYAAIGRDAMVPVYPVDETGDTAAEEIAAAVLWSNPGAFAVFNALGTVSSLPLLDGATPISGAAAAFTGDAATAARVASALSTLSAADPVVVVPEPAGSTASEQHGAGFELPGGWSAPFQVTHAEGQLSVARDPVVYVVKGTLDTEAIDAAASAAGAHPVVILCAALSELAAEDLAFRARRASQLDPLVVVVRGTDAARLDRLDDVSVRLGAVAVAGRPNDSIVPLAGAGALPVALVVADTVRTTFLMKSATLTAPMTTRLVNLKAARAAATDASTQALLDARITTFSGKAAALLVPDDGAHAASEVAMAVRMIQALRAVDRPPSELGELRLLDIAASREAPYGTAPTSDGLGVAVIEALEAALAAKITPPVGQRVVSNAEIALLGTLGLAGLMSVLAEKAKRADDAADFGFLQLQALLFKVREQLMGRDKALQMSASPMMANLADLIEGEGTPEQLSKFFDELKDAAAEQTQADTQPTWMKEAIQYTLPKETLYSTLEGYDPTRAVSSLFDQDFEKATSLEELTSPEVEAAPPKSSMGSLSYKGMTLKYNRYADSADVMARLGGTSGATSGAAAGATSGALDGLMGLSFAPAAGGTTTPAPGGSTPTTKGTFWSAPEIAEAVSQGSPNAASLGTRSVTVARMVHSAQFLRKIQPYAWTLRATGIKKRAEDARAIELRQEAFRLRASVLQTIARLEIHLSGLSFPGFLETYTTTKDGKTVTGIRAVEKVLVGPGIDTRALVAEVLQGKHDLQTPDANTASLNADAIQSLEITASMLRIVEGRVREVREAIELCRRAKVQIERQIFMAEQREDAVLAQLAEARHDVAATSALVAEEVARVEAVNARREKILANEVPFLVYHRCRMVELADDVAIHDLEPALTRSPVLEALRRPAPRAPEELRELVEAWRDAPARWLRPLVPLLPKVDTLASLIKALLDAQQRATRRLEQAAPPPRQVRGLRGMAAVQAMIQARQAAVAQSRAAAAALNAATIQAMNWRNAQIRAIQALSVEDLINSRAVRATVSRQVAHELENIYKVCANIYREFTEVAPELRAIWVQLLSEYDAPLDLHDLSRLPRWREVGQGDDGRRPDPFKKRELQALVTWLFDRVDPGEAEAREMMNDLVRVSILLASHAPVERILAGHVETVTPVEPDRQLTVRLPGAARVGMMAVIRTKAGVVTHARVVDVAEGRASLRLVGPAIAGAVLQAGDQVHLSEPDGVSVEDDDDDGPEERSGPLFLRASKTDGR